MSSTRSLVWHTCPEHGRHLHDSTVNGLRCVSCDPVTVVTKPQEKAPRKRPKRLRGVAYAPDVPNKRPGPVPKFDLTDAERRVAELLAYGKQADVARTLGVSRASVASTVNRGLRRLGVRSTAELVKYVQEQGRALA